MTAPQELFAPVSISRARHTAACLVIFGACLSAISGCTTVTYETLNQKILDAAITSLVKTKILNDPLAGRGEIDVESVNNRVYLKGVVPTVEEKRRAHEVAIEVPWVIGVVNDLHVREGVNL